VHRLSAERGLGVVVVLHDVNMAARFCDEILALKQGKLIARGSPEAIMTPGELQRIYGLAMDVLEHGPGRRPLAFPA